ERRRIISDSAEFGELKIEALLVKEKDPEAPIARYRIEGDDIRKIIASAMLEFDVAENEIALMVEVAMYERGKYLWFFGSDELVGKVAYFPIPTSSYHLGGRTNVKLNIHDDKGTDVWIKVKYDQPAVVAKTTGQEVKSDQLDNK